MFKFIMQYVVTKVRDKFFICALGGTVYNYKCNRKTQDNFESHSLMKKKVYILILYIYIYTYIFNFRTLRFSPKVEIQRTYLILIVFAFSQHKILNIVT
jgi:hypothetical protein